MLDEISSILLAVQSLANVIKWADVALILKLVHLNFLHLFLNLGLLPTLSLTPANNKTTAAVNNINRMLLKVCQPGDWEKLLGIG